MFGFMYMYIQMTKSYESLQSEHSLEYMPKTWTEVDEGEFRKECDAASPTASTMAPGPSRTSCKRRSEWRYVRRTARFHSGN